MDLEKVFLDHRHLLMHLAARAVSRALNHLCYLTLTSTYLPKLLNCFEKTHPLTAQMKSMNVDYS